MERVCLWAAIQLRALSGNDVLGTGWVHVYGQRWQKRGVCVGQCCQLSTVHTGMLLHSRLNTSLSCRNARHITALSQNYFEVYQSITLHSAFSDSFPSRPVIAAAPVFFLHVVWKRTCGNNWHRFFTGQISTQSVVSIHWRKPVILVSGYSLILLSLLLLFYCCDLLRWFLFCSTFVLRYIIEMYCIFNR